MKKLKVVVVLFFFFLFAPYASIKMTEFVEKVCVLLTEVKGLPFQFLVAEMLYHYSTGDLWGLGH